MERDNNKKWLSLSVKSKQRERKETSNFKDLLVEIEHLKTKAKQTKKNTMCLMHLNI